MKRPLQRTKGGAELPYLPMSRDKVLDDDSIVQLYFARDEKAIAETDLKYKNYLFSVALSIVNDREDSRECLNDTYLAAWNAIPPAKPVSLRAFLTVILRRIAINDGGDIVAMYSEAGKWIGEPIGQPETDYAKWVIRLRNADGIVYVYVEAKTGEVMRVGYGNFAE